MNALVFSRLRPSPGETVVEIGFGGGDLIARIASSGVRRVVGVDISEPMVARARRRFRSDIAAGRIQILQGAADSLPLETAAADIVISVNNIYFWPDAERAMGELARVLKAGGRAYICLETPESLRSWPGHRYGFRLYSADEVKAQMERAGFAEILTAEGSDPALGEFVCVEGVRR